MGRISELAKRAVYLNSYISIIDNNTVIVESCKSITECCDVVVKLTTAENMVEVWGNGLTATNYTNTSIEINGNISSVSIERRRSKL